MLAADADLQVRPRAASLLHAHLDELADADRVDRRERIALQDLAVLVRAEELADVVAREPEGELRQVIGAEREELRLAGDLIGRHRAARHFDHRADEVLDPDASLLHHVGRDAIDDDLLVP